MIIETIQNIDKFLFHQINQFGFRWVGLDIFGIFCAKYLEYVLWAILILFLILKFKDRIKVFLGAVASALVAKLVIVDIIRWIFPRLRPFAVDPMTNLLVNKSNELSFPSGHATFYFALSTFIFFYNKKIGILFYVISFMICLGRVFVGLHWPLDILSGALIGIFTSWVINKSLKRII